MLMTLVVIAVAGLALVWAGLRGRRVDDHPVCRRCGFDLIGGVGQKCTECGQDLALPKAIRIGNRRRIRGAIVLGALLLLGCLAVAGVLGAGARWNFNKHLPTALLMMESRGGTKTAGAAVAELLVRLKGGTLRDADARILVERGIALQGRKGAAWAQEWGEFLEAAWGKGLLTEEQKAQYVKNVVAFRFVMRDFAREGQKCGVSLEVTLARSGSAIQFNISPSLKTMQIGDRVFEGGPMNSTIGMMGAGGTGTVSEEIELNVLPGEYQVDSVWQLSVTTAASEDPIAVWEVNDKARINVLPRDAELVARITDESLRPAMEKALTVSRVTLSGSGETTRCTGRIQIKNPPAPMAFDVIVRDGTGREWKVGVVTVNAGEKLSHSTSFAANTPGLVGDTVDVIFRPNVDAAMRTVFMKEMWDGEVVVPGVGLGGK